MFLLVLKLPMESEKSGRWTWLRRIIIGYVSTAKQVDHKLCTCLWNTIALLVRGTAFPKACAI